MVEADDYLGGAAIQHRQVEGREADEFVDYFNHLEYLEGGISSGFSQVEPTKEKPLFFRFRPRGNGKGELVQVPMAVSSMDSKSGFILCVDKATVWAWHGQEVRATFYPLNRGFCCIAPHFRGIDASSFDGLLVFVSLIPLRILDLLAQNFQQDRLYP